MKRSAAILLILCLVLQTFRQSALLTTYDLNKELIVELFCVNKEKVSLHCQGSCFMKEQLGKEDPQKSSQQEIIPEQELKLFFAEEKAFFFDPEVEQKKSKLFSEEGKEQFWYEAVFHPPQIG